MKNKKSPTAKVGDFAVLFIPAQDILQGKDRIL